MEEILDKLIDDFASPNKCIRPQLISLDSRSLDATVKTLKIKMSKEVFKDDEAS